MRGLANRDAQGLESRVDLGDGEVDDGALLRPQRLESSALSSGSANASAIVSKPAQASGRGEQRVPGVEQPELALLIGTDVARRTGAGGLPLRPPAREVALRDTTPRERLGHDRSRGRRSPMSSRATARSAPSLRE